MQGHNKPGPDYPALAHDSVGLDGLSAAADRGRREGLHWRATPGPCAATEGRPVIQEIPAEVQELRGVPRSRYPSLLVSRLHGPDGLLVRTDLAL